MNSTRRHLLNAIATLLAYQPFRLFASEADVQAKLQQLLNDIAQGRELLSGATEDLRVSLPPIAETGNSVSLELDWREDLVIRRIHLVLPGNPEPLAAQFHFTAFSAPGLKTRIRLARTQTIAAVAETDGGELLVAKQSVTVTLGACIDEYFS